MVSGAMVPRAFIESVFAPGARRQVEYQEMGLGWTDDGHPGRVVEGEVRPHPLYPRYVIGDLLRAWRRSGDAGQLEAAKLVAAAAVRRMEEVDGALVYLTAPEWVPGRREPFLSALSVSHYTSLFGELAQATGEREYEELARRAVRGMAIPTGRGGVLLERPYGPVLEEFPNDVPVYILNGWTTALLGLFTHAERFDDAWARDFALAGCEALAAIIDRFDVEPLANTRYALAGHVWVRLQPAEPESVRFLGGEVTLPADGSFPFGAEPGDRWQNWYDPARVGPDGAVLDRGGPADANVVLSASGDRATLRFDLDVAVATGIEFLLPVGEYDPLDSGLRVTGWRAYRTGQFERGQRSFEVTVPMAELPLVGYPTNFTKGIGERTHNVYHHLHVTNLKRIAKLTRDPRFVDWLVKWVEYVRLWRDMPVYRDDARVDLTYTPSGRPLAY